MYYIIIIESHRNNDKKLRWTGIEPGSTAWKAAMLTIIPPSLPEGIEHIITI